MKLFTAKKDHKRLWTEHYLYMVAVCDVCGGGAEARVLDNILYYASADLSTVLMAKFDAGRSTTCAKLRSLRTLLKQSRSTVVPASHWVAGSSQSQITRHSARKRARATTARSRGI
ncbi:unnamed protein product [Peronospora farinosa]|uniref:Uncharacterized protein n=1 Tax=Peronospora farinosa TaxID=134698 RepID=A0AAV0UBL7_9STRA|nr:unnamed protein product [Peronospora farinosa]